MRKNRRDKSLR